MPENPRSSRFTPRPDAGSEPHAPPEAAVMAEDRVNILSAIVLALDHWAEISEVVAGAASRRDAMDALMAGEHHFSEEGANHVLDLRVVSLSASARQDLAEELAQLKKHLQELSET